MKPWALALSFVAGCSAAAGDDVGEDTAAKVIGASELTPVTDDGANLPAKYAPLLDAFGLLEISPTNHCTATHLGNGIVVTAGHCFDAPATETRDLACPAYTIRWGYRVDRAPYLASTCTRVLAAETNRQRDYVLFTVSPVPRAFVRAALGRSPAVGTALTVFSHPSHRPLEWSRTCTLAASTTAPTEFFHGCDTEPASSGATVLDDTTLEVIGIHDGAQGAANYGTYLDATPLAQLLGAAH